MIYCHNKCSHNIPPSPENYDFDYVTLVLLHYLDSFFFFFFFDKIISILLVYFVYMNLNYQYRTCYHVASIWNIVGNKSIAPFVVYKYCFWTLSAAVQDFKYVMVQEKYSVLVIIIMNICVWSKVIGLIFFFYFIIVIFMKVRSAF